MIKLLTLLLASFLGGESTRREKIVVDNVDLIEVNYVYDDTGRVKYAQLIFWEWKRRLLLPQKNIYGKENGVWYQGAGMVVVDCIVYHNRHIEERLEKYAIPRRSKRGWTSEFYHRGDSCNRRVHAKYYTTTRTEYDIEIINKVLWPTQLRKGLTEPVPDIAEETNVRLDDFMRELTSFILNGE